MVTDKESPIPHSAERGFFNGSCRSMSEKQCRLARPSIVSRPFITSFVPDRFELAAGNFLHGFSKKHEDVSRRVDIGNWV